MTGIAVELRNIGAAFGARTALRDIDLRVASGERLAVLGPNGAGKSTLLRCLTGAAGVERRGTVLLDATPLEEYGRETLARRIAVVGEGAMPPFAMRVEEVVALGRIPHEHPLRGLRPPDREAVARAISRVGIDTLVGRNARELSLGERQLVALAMTLAQEGRLILLDEPTVHLDLHHRVHVMELLRDLNERDGTTIVAVLHDLALATHFFPRLVLLQAGRVIADGPPAEVLTRARIHAVFGVDPALMAIPALG